MIKANTNQKPFQRVNSSFYWKLRFLATSAWEELWTWYCFENNAVGTETLSSETCREVLVYFPYNKTVSGATLAEDFNREIAGVPGAVELLEQKLLQSEDWQSNWREHFKPVALGKHLLVKPSWMNLEPETGRIPLTIDPGRGFGTGHHLSTVLCLEMLEIHMLEQQEKPCRVLDVGTGSGILSIAACLLGVEKAYALELEADAILETLRNTMLNGLESRILPIQADSNCFSIPFPLVISNMLLCELKKMAQELAALTEKNGVLICSGLLKDQVPELEEVLNKMGMILTRHVNRDGWSSIMFRY